MSLEILTVDNSIKVLGVPIPAILSIDRRPAQFIRGIRYDELKTVDGLLERSYRLELLYQKYRRRLIYVVRPNIAADLIDNEKVNPEFDDRSLFFPDVYTYIKFFKLLDKDFAEGKLTEATYKGILKALDGLCASFRDTHPLLRGFVMGPIVKGIMGQAPINHYFAMAKNKS